MLKMAGPSSSAHQMQNNTASFTVASKYRFVRKIGGGSFGDVYLAVHIRTGEEVAVKLENASAPHVGALKTEYKVYHALKGKEGVPGVRWFGPEHNFNALVFDLLGESLEEKFDYCERKFTLKTVVTLADQMISRIEQLHNHFYIHRDIKPDNFLMGVGRYVHRVYLVDFGLAKKYRDAKGNHILPRQDKKDLTGTARYASVNAHFGFEQSRRDDLESLGYVLIYFMRGGQLPWQGLKDLPQEFAMFLRYCRGLRFDEAPDYEYLRALFRALKLAGNFNYDFAFDWVGKPERDKLAHQRAVAAAEAKKAAVFVQQQMRISPMKTPSALRGIERKRAYAPDETFAAAAYDSPRRRRHEAAAGCSREEENEQEQGGFLEMLQQLPGASFGGGAKRRRVQEADLFGVIGLEEQEEASVGYHFEEMRVMRPDHQEEREESNGRYHHHRQDDRQRDDGQWERVGSYRHPDNRQRAEEQDFGGRYHSQENRNREELSGRYHHQEDRQSEEERDDFAGGYHHRQEDRRRERSPSPAGGLFDLEVRSQPSHNPLAVFFPEAPSNPLFPDAEEVRRRQESDAADGFFPWL